MKKRTSLEKLPRKKRTELARVIGTSTGTLDHIASGIRKASAEMAIKIEEGSVKLGWAPITRESLCGACKKCSLAKTARKAEKEEAIW